MIKQNRCLYIGGFSLLTATIAHSLYSPSKCFRFFLFRTAVRFQFSTLTADQPPVLPTIFFRQCLWLPLRSASDLNCRSTLAYLQTSVKRLPFSPDSFRYYSRLPNDSNFFPWPPIWSCQFWILLESDSMHFGREILKKCWDIWK